MQSQFRNGYICYGQKNVALILKYLILNSAQIRTLWFTASHAHTNAGNFNVSPSIASSGVAEGIQILSRDFQ